MESMLTAGCWLSLYIAIGSLFVLYLPSSEVTNDESQDELPQPNSPNVHESVNPRLKSGEGLVNCTSLEELTDLEWIASGWTKAVYKGRFRGREIAVKTVNLDGHDIETCLARPERPSLARCYRRASAKILRELILLRELDHPNVIKVLGSCIPDAVGPVVIATELGEPLDSMHLLQLTWQERIKLAYSVASLLHHLAHSPLGSLLASDLKKQQFVLVNGQLKLADVDDLGISEPTCVYHSDCRSPIDEYNMGDAEPVFCVSGRCEGHNERSNILRAGLDFVPHVLPLSAPATLEPHIRQLVEAYQGLHHWDSLRILEATKALISTSS